MFFGHSHRTLNFPSRIRLRRPLLTVVMMSLATLATMAQDPLRVGYVVLRANPGAPLPVASALYSLRNPAGVLISEAGVGAVQPIRAGRILVDERDSLTGLALANPSDQSVTLDLTLRDAAGASIGTGVVVLPAGGQTARFVRDPPLFPSTPSGFVGSLTFVCRDSGRVAAITIRQGANSHGEPVFATLPVADLDESDTEALVLPHVGAGQGLSTQVVLINRTGSPVSGEIRFQASNGSPLTGSFGGSSGSVFPYSISANGVFEGTLTSAAAIVQGFARVTVSGGAQSPVGTAIFQFRSPGGEIVSEAGVGAIPATNNARILVDTVNTQTGVALANPGNQAVQVTLQLRDRNNLQIASIVRGVPANGHLASFVSDLFSDLPLGFTGQLAIVASAPVVPVTLKLTTNSRGEFILTTLPLADTTRPPAGDHSVIPQVGFGTAGFQIATRLILISPNPALSRGSASFFGTDGGDLQVEVTGAQTTQIAYDLLPLAVQQFRPENKNPAALIMIDPQQPFLLEISLSTGGTTVVRPLVIDSAGEFRDDFPMNFASLDTSVALVGRNGLVRGVGPGFSSIVVTAGGIVTAITASVAEFTEGVGGYEITGVAPDNGGRFYLASSPSNQIFLSEDPAEAPDIYAGTGDLDFLDGPRPTSRFGHPSHLALNLSVGSLFVADTANNRIRLVAPGTAGQVSTFAGPGAPGNLALVQFNGPLGVALDHKGFLWIADTGNQVIRRISLADASATTVAGQLGVTGSADGAGSAATFSNPTGIAVEPVPLATLLEGPAPPVSVIVSDAASGLIRRVTESGEVSTIPVFDTLPPAQSAALERTRTQRAEPRRFGRPTGAAVDRFGIIYVSDSESGALFSIAPDGRAAPIGGPGTLTLPRAVAVSSNGLLAVADGSSAIRTVRFGAPVIESVTPSQVDSDGGQVVQIKGRNFSPETQVVLNGSLVDASVNRSGDITFTSPPLPAGPLPLNLQNRGGIADSELLVTEALDQLQAGEITTFAGGGAFGRDGAPGAKAQTSSPTGLALDNQGNLYIAERLGNRIRFLDGVSGIVGSAAGSGLTEPFADNTPARQATFSGPTDVAVDAAGNVFVADTANHRVRRIDANTGIVTTVAGTGQPGFGLDGSLAVNEPLNAPHGVVADRSGNLYIADTGNHRIRRVGRGGIITTLAGNGQPGSSGDGGGALQARLNAPEGVAVDAAGNVFFADTGNNRVRRVDPQGFIHAYAGTGQAAYSGDGGAPGAAALNHPEALAIDSNGAVYIADTGNNRIRRVIVTPAGNQVISTVAGGVCCPQGEGIPATSSMLFGPSGVAVDAGGNIWISDTNNQRVRRVDGRSGLIFTVLGGDNQGDAGSNAPIFLQPFDVAFDSDGNLFIADRDGFRVRRIDGQTGEATTVAGNGKEFVIGPNGPTSGVGDGLPATQATVGAVSGVAVDSRGNLYLADPTHHRIRRVDRQGIITTVAGTGVAGYSGNQELPSPALEAMLNTPMGVAVDAFDRVFISDNGNNLIRMVDAGGNISNIAGFVGSDPNVPPGQYGNGGSARGANLSLLNGGKVAIDPAGAVYIADTGHRQVRRIQAPGEPFPGRIENVADIFEDLPLGVALDRDGNAFVSVRGNQVRRLIGGGRTRAVAGTGVAGYSGDGGPALDANLNYPVGIAFDKEGNLYISDSQNHRIRVVRGAIP